MKLWLDDLREAPQGWVWAKTVKDAKAYLETGTVTHASLDNDTGGKEGRKLVLWMAETGNWPTESCVVHSMNPVAKEYMQGMIERYML